jgi:flagellar biosynthesis GTPase FlhF
MPADLRYEDLEDLGRAYAEIGTKRAIATRFDLTKRRASVVFALHKADIALAQISATPFITGGIALASAHRVAALLLEPFDDIKAEDAA